MSVFQYLLSIAVIQLVFGFLWTWIALLFVVPLLLVRLPMPLVSVLTKAVGYYFMASLTVVVTLGQMERNPELQYLFPVLGGIMLFFAATSAWYETEKAARENYDYEKLQNTRHDWIVYLALIPFYVLSLFFPAIVVNSKNAWFLSVIQWAWDLPILGWIIGLFAFFLVLSTGFYSLVALIMLIASGVSLLAHRRPESVRASEEDYSEHSSH